MQTIAIISQKGGVGKTTISTHLGVAGTLDGLGVAIADVDPQSSAEEWFDERKSAAPEVIGVKAKRLPKLIEDRIKHWMGVGAQPTDRVLRFLDKAGMAKRDARSNPNKGQPGKKRVEREEAKIAAAAEKAKAAAEAAAAPPPAPEPAPEGEQPAAE